MFRAKVFYCILESASFPSMSWCMSPRCNNVTSSNTVGSGLKEALKKRLKAYYKRRKLSAAHIQPNTARSRVDFLLVIDFEATCQENTTDYRHEIIEFPIVVIDTQKCQVVSDTLD